MKPLAVWQRLWLLFSVIWGVVGLLKIVTLAAYGEPGAAQFVQPAAAHGGGAAASLSAAVGLGRAARAAQRRITMDPKLFRKLATLGVAIVAVLVAAVLGAWGYSSYRERALHQALAPQERAADARLREALAAPLEPAANEAEQAAAKLEAAAQDIEARLEALKKLDAAAGSGAGRDGPGGAQRRGGDRAQGGRGGARRHRVPRRARGARRAHAPRGLARGRPG